jgi:transposase
VTARLIALLATLKIMWADTGYNGAPLRDWMRDTAGITLEIWPGPAHTRSRS